MANDGVRRAAMLGWAPSVLAALDEEEAGDALDLLGKVNKAGDTVTGDLLLASGRPWVSIRAKGAVGNFATTDDRAAIQSAIDAAGTLAAAAGAQVDVYLDAGTYGFSILAGTTPLRAFTMRPGVRITGPGVLKLRNAQGNYGAIFGAPEGTNVTGFELDGVTVDINATNNALGGAADMTVGDTNEARFILFCTNGDRVRVRRCRFLDVGDCVNAIVVNGSGTTADDFELTDSRFYGCGQAAFAHDCSMVYWVGRAGQKCNVSRNHFYARSPGLGGNTAAIELHGSNQICDDNYVQNFMLGGYITGNAAETATSCSWKRNTFNGVAGGVELLPNAHGGAAPPSGYGIAQAEVDGNIVIVDRDQWFSRTDISGSTGFAEGLFLQEGTDLPADDVRITNNTVVYLASAQASDAGWSYKDTAYSWTRTSSTITDRNVRISGNRSYSALSAGMALSGKFLGLTVDDNKHYDPGNHVNLPGGAGSAYRVGTLFVGTDPTCVHIDRNETIDTRGTHKVVANVYLDASGTATDCVAEDNAPTQCADGTTTVRNVIAAAPAFYIRCREKNLLAAPTDTARFGSVIIDEANGKLYRQTAAPSGTTWGAEILPGLPQVLDHSGTTGIAEAIRVQYQNALAGGSRFVWRAGVTETARIENELIGGTDGPLKFSMFTSQGLIEGMRLRDPASGETGMLVVRNVGGTYSLQRVSMGAADSGGTGFKLLRVPN